MIWQNLLNTKKNPIISIYGKVIESDIAEKLATGELTAADYKSLQSKKPVETEESSYQMLVMM